MDEIIGLFKSRSTSLSQPSPIMTRELASECSAASYPPPTMGEEETSSFESLPAEIINYILTFLPPVALAQLSLTSQLLRSHAHNDLLWLNFVRENVPDISELDSPSPAESWRQLYLAHHPYWFLARHKVWFADVPNTGKIILARYNSRRGCIEGYQLIAEHGAHTFENWTFNNDVIIHTFDPKIRLWIDDPVINLDIKKVVQGKRLQKEIAMHTDSGHGICSMISLCQSIPKSRQSPSMALWPPSVIPSEQRVRNESPNKFRTVAHRPQSLGLMSDQTFRIRKWLEFSNLMQPLNSIRMGEEVMTFSTLPAESYKPTIDKPYQGIWVGDYSGHGCEFLLVLQREVSSSTTMSREASAGSLPEGMSITEIEAETPEERDASIRQIVEDDMNEDPVAIGDPLHIDHQDVIAGPSTEDPERMHEPEDSYAGTPSSPKSGPNSSQFTSTMTTEDGRYGRLEAIKLTGDINVPRGHYTWIADDIGPKGFIRVGKEQMFKGARMVKSWGRIAGRGFKHDRFIPSQLIMISHDTLAQYWEVCSFLDTWFSYNVLTWYRTSATSLSTRESTSMITSTPTRQSCLQARRNSNTLDNVFEAIEALRSSCINGWHALASCINIISQTRLVPYKSDLITLHRADLIHLRGIVLSWYLRLAAEMYALEGYYK